MAGSLGFHLITYGGYEGCVCSWTLDWRAREKRKEKKGKRWKYWYWAEERWKGAKKKWWIQTLHELSICRDQFQRFIVADSEIWSERREDRRRGEFMCFYMFDALKMKRCLVPGVVWYFVSGLFPSSWKELDLQRKQVLTKVVSQENKECYFRVGGGNRWRKESHVFLTDILMVGSGVREEVSLWRACAWIVLEFRSKEDEKN